MNKGFCFLLKFLTGFENNRHLAVFPEVFGMLLGRLRSLRRLLRPWMVPLWTSSREWAMQDSSAHWPRFTLCLKSYPSPSLLPGLCLTASPKAPCLSTFHCWQKRGLFIQNTLVFWILNSLKVPGSGFVVSHCYYILSTRHVVE